MCVCICSRRVNGADEWLYCSVIQRECDMHTHIMVCEESVLHKLIGDSTSRLYYYEPAIMHGLEFDLALLLSS